MYYNFKKKAKKTGDSPTSSSKNGSTSKLASSGKNPYESFLILGAMFLCGLLYLYIVYLYFPQMDEAERKLVKLPTSMEDAKNLGRILKKYNQDHFYNVLVSFFSYYVFLQTFAIPGSIFLSIMSGFLYPFPLALLLVCTCTTLGAAFCFALSHLAARKIMLRYFRSRIVQFQKKVETLKNDLLWYIIFLRITPIVPNWFINLTSPIINIPLFPFLLGTFLGVAPPSLVYIQAGKTLNDLVSTSSVFSAQSVIALVFVSLLSLTPVALPKLFPKWYAKFNPKLKN
jgi:uncharacterized membrane protein YdjX (TVP38/TMEM64 family)